MDEVVCNILRLEGNSFSIDKTPTAGLDTQLVVPLVPLAVYPILQYQWCHWMCLHLLLIVQLTEYCSEDTAQRILLRGYCSEDTAQRILLRGYCSEDTAQRILLRGYCSEDTAQRILLRGYCSEDTAQRILLRGYCSSVFTRLCLRRGPTEDTDWLWDSTQCTQ